MWTGSGENIRSARSSRVVLSKILVARKANVYLCSCSLKRSQYSHARECSKRPLVIPINEGLTFPYALHGRAFLALVVVT